MNSIPTINGLNLEAFLNFTIDPTRTEEIFKVQQALLPLPNRAEMTQWAQKAVTENAKFMALYNEKYFAKLPSMENLAAMPAGSLGWSLHKHLSDNNIKLNFEGLDTDVFYKVAETHIGYLSIRGFQHHDTYHTILGLGTSPVDEFALFAFQLGQYHSSYHTISLASGLLNAAFFAPETLPELFRKITYFYNLGQKCEFFPGVKFEEDWETPLTVVQEKLRVSPIPKV